MRAHVRFQLAVMHTTRSDKNSGMWSADPLSKQALVVMEKADCGKVTSDIL